MLAWCQSGYWINTEMRKVGMLVTKDLDGYKQLTSKD